MLTLLVLAIAEPVWAVPSDYDVQIARESLTAESPLMSAPAPKRKRHLFSIWHSGHGFHFAAREVGGYLTPMQEHDNCPETTPNYYCLSYIPP